MFPGTAQNIIYGHHHIIIHTDRVIPGGLLLVSPVLTGELTDLLFDPPVLTVDPTDPLLDPPVLPGDPVAFIQKRQIQIVFI